MVRCFCPLKWLDFNEDLPDWMTSRRVDPKDVFRSLILSKISRVRCFFNRDLQLVASWSFWNPASNFSDTAASTILIQGGTRRGICNSIPKISITNSSTVVLIFSTIRIPLISPEFSVFKQKSFSPGGVVGERSTCPEWQPTCGQNSINDKTQKKSATVGGKRRRASLGKMNMTPCF